MAVDKLSSHCRKYLKYKTSTAVGRRTKQRVTNQSQSWVSNGQTEETQDTGHTSHAIVGEPLAELIDDDEEDAQGVAKTAQLEARDRQHEPRAVQHRLTLLTAT